MVKVICINENSVPAFWKWLHTVNAAELNVYTQVKKN